MRGFKITKVVDKSARFIPLNAMAIDRALNNAAVDIVRLSVAQVPHDTGTLQRSNRIKRIGLMKFEVSYNTPYARRWEFETPPGGFKKGRKSRYLSDPGDLITRKANMVLLIHEAIRRIRV